MQLAVEGSGKFRSSSGKGGVQVSRPRVWKVPASSAGQGSNRFRGEVLVPRARSGKVWEVVVQVKLNCRAVGNKLILMINPDD